MVFSEEDRIVIQYLHQNQNYSAKRFLREFPDKGWNLGGLNYLLHQIDNNACVELTASNKQRAP